MKTAIRNSLVLMGLVISGCGSSSTAGDAGGTAAAAKSLGAVVSATALADGAVLYTGNCAGCHGMLTSSTKLGADSSRIQNAITGNTGGMGSLSTLAPLQVQAIASALAVTAAGTSSYVSNCAVCHGVITTSSKIGADYSRIQNAINNNTGGMGTLSTLAAADIQAISAVLTAP